MLADAQTRKVAARATGYALLHAARAAGDHAMRSEGIATLSELEVGFLQAQAGRTQVRSCHRCLVCYRIHIFLLRIGELRKRRSCSRAVT